MVESFLAAFGLTPSDMPAVNAALNGLAAVLLLAGYSFIRARRVTPHKWSMIAAFTVSVIFLASYLYFHLVVKRGEPTRFTAIGWPRYLYFTILTTHTILAAAVAVLVPITLVLGFGAAGNRHRRWLVGLFQSGCTCR